jgi:uncharacterized protein (DUF58 family)
LKIERVRADLGKPMPNYHDPAIVSRITPLGLRARSLVEGTISGLHRSPLHGVSVEFADYREYVPGDDLKRLDWRAFGRSNRFYIKRYEEESNLRATILVDASASMRYAGKRSAMRKFDYAATLAASLAALCVHQRDAVGLCLFDSEQRTWLRPAATEAQLAKIIDAMGQATLDRETDLGAALVRVAGQIRGRGLVIVVSDFLADLDAVHDGLGRLRHAGHEIILFHVLDPDEIELPFEGSVLFRDLEGPEQVMAEPWGFRKAYRAAMEKFIAETTARCRSASIDYVLMKTSEDLGAALSSYLHGRTRVGATGVG